MLKMLYIGSREQIHLVWLEPGFIWEDTGAENLIWLHFEYEMNISNIGGIAVAMIIIDNKIKQISFS